MPVLPGIVAVDHIGITVPDIKQAHWFFTDVLGCEALFAMGPRSDPNGRWMKRHLGVDPRAVINEIRFYRLGGQAIFEVFEYEAPSQQRLPPQNSDIGGHHVAIYVEDLDAAIEALRANYLQVMAGPTTSTGATAGQRWIYFLSPWGMQFELVSYPDGRAFEHDPAHFDGVRPIAPSD